MLFVPHYHAPRMVLAAGGQPPLGLQDHLQKTRRMETHFRITRGRETPLVCWIWQLKKKLLGKCCDSLSVDLSLACPDTN